MITPNRTICNKCKGCGNLVDDQNGKPWADADRAAVRAGTVTPATCDACKGVGSIPEANPVVAPGGDTPTIQTPVAVPEVVAAKKAKH